MICLIASIVEKAAHPGLFRGAVLFQERVELFGGGVNLLKDIKFQNEYHDEKWLEFLKPGGAVEIETNY